MRINKIEVNSLIYELIYDREINSDDIKILYVTSHFDLYSYSTYPCFIAEFNGELIYCVCDYVFDLFEDYSDWEGFNSVTPGKGELDKLMSLNPNFYKINYSKALEFCDDFSKYELDLIKVYNRNSLINKLIY